MSLSLCMLVKDEEATLPRCLSSVQAVVDEMIVLDTGSTDHTREVAAGLGARVYSFEWCNDFAIARNEALNYAHGNWILVLDADEVLVPAIIPSLQQLLQKEEILLVNLLRQEVGATQSPYSLVSRLFRNHPQIRFSRPYHALIDDSVERLLQQEPGWHIVSLPEVAILHEGYHPDAIIEHNKFARARAAMEKYLAQHPCDPYVCSKLGALSVQVGELERGIELLERGLRTNQIDPTVLYELHYHLGIASSRLHNSVQAVAHYCAAIEQPLLPLLKLGAYNNLGNVLKAQGDLSGALAAYDKVLQIDPTLAAGHYNRGLTLRARGDLQGAVAAYKSAIALNPNYAEAYQNLGVALLKLGRQAESLTAFQQAIARYQKRQPQEAEHLHRALIEMGLKL